MEVEEQISLYVVAYVFTKFEQTRAAYGQNFRTMNDNALNPPKVAAHNFTKAVHERLDYRVDFVQLRLGNLSTFN